MIVNKSKPVKLEPMPWEKIKNLKTAKAITENLKERGFQIRENEEWHITSTEACHGGDRDDGFQYKDNDFGGSVITKCHSNPECPANDKSRHDESTIREFCRHFSERIRVITDREVLGEKNGLWAPLIFGGTVGRPEITDQLVEMCHEYDDHIKSYGIFNIAVLLKGVRTNPTGYGLQVISRDDLNNRELHPVIPMRDDGEPGNRKCFNVVTKEPGVYKPEWFMQNYQMEGCVPPDFTLLDSVKARRETDDPQELVRWFLEEHIGMPIVHRLGYLLRGSIKDITPIIIPTSGAGKSTLLEIMKSALGVTDDLDASQAFSGSDGRFTQAFEGLKQNIIFFLNEADKITWNAAQVNKLCEPTLDHRDVHTKLVKVPRLGNVVMIAGGDLKVNSGAQGVSERIPNIWGRDIGAITRPERIMMRSKEALVMASTILLNAAWENNDGADPKVTGAEAAEWAEEWESGLVKALRRQFEYSEGNFVPNEIIKGIIEYYEKANLTAEEQSFTGRSLKAQLQKIDPRIENVSRGTPKKRGWMNIRAINGLPA